MIDSGQLKQELEALQDEASRLLHSTGEAIGEASRGHAEALGDQIKAALNDLCEVLSEQEDHLEDIVSERPIAALASALALGVVIGFMLRRG